MHPLRSATRCGRHPKAGAAWLEGFAPRKKAPIFRSLRTERREESEQNQIPHESTLFFQSAPRIKIKYPVLRETGEEKNAEPRRRGWKSGYNEFT